MCDHTPIKWHHVLRNQQTSSDLIVGSECINNYKIITGERVVFPARFQRAAKRLNTRHPNCVVVVPAAVASDPVFDDDWDFEDQNERERLTDLGLDPDDPDPTELAPHGMSGDEDDDSDDSR